MYAIHRHMESVPNSTDRTDRISLVRALAVAIANRLREILRRESDVGEDDSFFVHHMYQSDFEIACDVLWRLGVSYGSFAKDRGPSRISRDEYLRARDTREKLIFPPFFSVPSAVEVKELLGQALPKAMPSVELIIEAYLRVATDYGSVSSTHLPTARGAPFVATHPDQIPVLEEFARFGYARRAENMYVWTNQMLPMMAHIWLWTEDDIDLSSVDQARMLDEAMCILKSLELPDSDQQRRNLWNLSIPFRALEIQYHWDGQCWLDRLSNAPRLTFDEALAVSSLLEGELDG